MSLVLQDASLLGTAGPHRFIFTLHHEVMSPWETAIWSHLNEMLSGRQMLLLFCYGCLSPKFSDRALYSWVLCCCLQSELKWLNVINTLTLVGLLSHYSCTYISFTFLTNPQFRARLVVQMNSAWNTYSLPAHDRCIYRLCLPEMKHSIRVSVSLCLCRVFAWMRLFLWARLYILIVQFS